MALQRFAIKDLSGHLLDEAVRIALKRFILSNPAPVLPADFRPSQDWASGGPLLEAAGILVGENPGPGSDPAAAAIGNDWDSAEHMCTGQSYLEAGMRIFVLRFHGNFWIDIDPDTAA